MFITMGRFEVYKQLQKSPHLVKKTLLICIHLGKSGPTSLRLDSDGLCSPLEDLVNVLLTEFGPFILFIHDGPVGATPQQILNLLLGQLLLHSLRHDTVKKIQPIVMCHATQTSTQPNTHMHASMHARTHAPTRCIIQITSAALNVTQLPSYMQICSVRPDAKKQPLKYFNLLELS